MSDFDGTMVEEDLGTLVLEKFAEGNWRTYDERYEEGRVTLEECLRSQSAMVRSPRRTILRAIVPLARFRPGVEDLVQFCADEGIPIEVASAGVDFVIRGVLRRARWSAGIVVHAPRSRCTRRGMEVTFPQCLEVGAENLKEDRVRHHRRTGARVVYIGDGATDYPAARSADLALAIRGSRLANLCKVAGVPRIEIDDFRDALAAVRAFLAGSKSLGPGGSPSPPQD